MKQHDYQHAFISVSVCPYDLPAYISAELCPSRISWHGANGYDTQFENSYEHHNIIERTAEVHTDIQ